MITQVKAKISFDNLNATERDPKVPPSIGSAGWSESFKGRRALLPLVSTQGCCG
jgi:hypothetical protein